MSISSALTALNQDIQNARTAIVNKGGTVTTGGGSSQLAADIATISGSSSGKYKLLDRVKDDSNNEIGTVSGFFTDANAVEYAVVCLDSAYRASTGQWASATGLVTNMPSYTDPTVYEAKETATQNTTWILAAKTSSACTHCRSKTFTIDGIIYVGQLPNILELIDIFRHQSAINNLDTSGGSVTITGAAWSSTQSNASNGRLVNTNGNAGTNTKTTSTPHVFPILEIPNGE